MLMYLSRHKLLEIGGSSNTSRSFVVSEASSKCAKIELASIVVREDVFQIFIMHPKILTSMMSIC
jgi:hypothetical protein